MKELSTERAIEALHTVRAYYANLTAWCPKGKDRRAIGDVMCSEIANSCLMAIKALEQQPCEDCISREQALKYSHIEYDDDGEGHRVIYTEDIEELPSVTQHQEVILCKDCKHWTNNIGDSKLRDNYCNEKAHGNFYRCSGDDYCSFAERRTDE